MDNQNSLAVVRRREIVKAGYIVEYLTPEEIERMVEVAKTKKKNRDRDTLFIRFLFITGARVSEAIGVEVRDVKKEGGVCYVFIRQGKGNKKRKTGIPEAFYNEIMAYAYKKGLLPDKKLFPFNRQRGWQIIKGVSKKAGIDKNVYPHLLRHSDAIYRLKKTGNPKALQHHLGHSTITMTMRYLATLTEEEAVKIEAEVEF